LFLPIIAYTLSSVKLDIRANSFFWVLRGWGEHEGVGWVIRDGVGGGREMTQTLYAHTNKKFTRLQIILAPSDRNSMKLAQKQTFVSME
jgi:hypothetical protein